MKSSDFSRAAAALLALVLLLCMAAPSAWAGQRKVRRKVAPEYPELAKRMNIQGAVLVKVRVAPDGSVTDVHVVRGNGLLEAAAKQAAKEWKFAPGQNSSSEKIVVEFKLKDWTVSQRDADEISAAWLPIPR